MFFVSWRAGVLQQIRDIVAYAPAKTWRGRLVRQTVVYEHRKYLSDSKNKITKHNQTL